MSAIRRNGGRRVAIWMLCLILVIAGFYALDHFVMYMQGLPLNADLTPAG